MPAKPKLDKAAKKEARREKRGRVEGAPAADLGGLQDPAAGGQEARPADGRGLPGLAVLLVVGIGLIFDVQWLVLPIGIALGVLAR